MTVRDVGAGIGMVLPFRGRSRKPGASPRPGCRHPVTPATDPHA